MAIASLLILVSKLMRCAFNFFVPPSYFTLSFWHVILTLARTVQGYPNCKISEPWKIGDGVCDQQYNDKGCLYDGDDCCPLNANDFDAKDLYGGKGLKYCCCSLTNGNCVRLMY